MPTVCWIATLLEHFDRRNCSAANCPLWAQTDRPLERIAQARMRLVDGSFFKLAAGAGPVGLQKGQSLGGGFMTTADARLDLQLCALRCTPECLEINGRGTSRDRQPPRGTSYLGACSMLARSRDLQLQLPPGDAGPEGRLRSSRIKTSQKFTTQKDLPLTQQDQEVQVLSDTTGVLTGDPYRPRRLRRHCREVRIADASRTPRARDPAPDQPHRPAGTPGGRGLPPHR